jgi:hypothetical protein
VLLLNRPVCPCKQERLKDSNLRKNQTSSLAAGHNCRNQAIRLIEVWRPGRPGSMSVIEIFQQLPWVVLCARAMGTRVIRTQAYGASANSGLFNCEINVSKNPLPAPMLVQVTFPYSYF